MFFRAKTTPSGTVLQLIESYRNAEGQPRQRLVASLGDAAIDEADRPLVARAVERRLRGAGSGELVEVELPESVGRWAEVIVRRVRAGSPAAGARRGGSSLAAATAAATTTTLADSVVVERVTHEETALLGGVLLGHDAWVKLGMDEFLESLGFNASQRLAAAVNVINRLVDPVSENALGDWVSHTALPELLGAAALRVPRDRFYRVSDRLVASHREIEAHLRRRQQELFGLERTLVLYDLTNTYFEGAAAANPKARRGKSKEGRDECPQLVVGMVFDEHGFELAHEVFDGGTNDSTTLQTMVGRLRKSLDDGQDLLAAARPLVILDGGIATKANRAYLRTHGWSYLVNETRSARAKWAGHFAQDEAFEPIEGREGKSGVRVRLIEHDAGGQMEHVVLCKSDGRRQKELAIRSRAEQRFVVKLEALARRVTSGRLKDAAAIERCIGRIASQHPRVARFYDVRFERSPAAKVVWDLRGQPYEEHDALLGCYALRCCGAPTLDARRLWEIYMTLSRAEDGFRCLKSDLGLRPIRHQRPQRADGHIFICVLAYHLMRQILHRLRLAGDHRSWDTVRRVVCTHVYATIVIPTLHHGTHRVRRPGRPDTLQSQLYSRLGIDWENLPVTKEHIAPMTQPIL